MRPRIIVFEDDTDTRNLLSLVLQGRGYEVISAAEPLGCPLYTDLDANCNHDHACGDFLLTDNRMPRMTGLQFVARQGVRGCKGVVHNKAVASGTWSEDEKWAAEQLGCKVFSKPYKLADIFSWLDERERQIQPGRKLADLGQL